MRALYIIVLAPPEVIYLQRVTLAVLEAGMDERTITKAGYQHASVCSLGLTGICVFWVVATHKPVSWKLDEAYLHSVTLGCSCFLCYCCRM